MTKMTRIFMMSAALMMIAAPAIAKDATFQTAFNLDPSASVSVNYENFKRTAKTACRLEINRAGFRTGESTSWQQRKCEQQLLKRAVFATKNQFLIARHERSNTLRPVHRQFASSN